MSLDGILSNLLHAPGAAGAAFLDPQGQVIAHAGLESELDVLGAYQSVWLNELTRASERSGLGTLRDIVLEFGTLKVLASEVKDGYFLLVLLDRSGVSAMVRARLDEARSALAAEIG